MITKVSPEEAKTLHADLRFNAKACVRINYEAVRAALDIDSREQRLYVRVCIRSWLRHNCEEYYHMTPGTVYFQNEHEAIKFHLTLG